MPLAIPVGARLEWPGKIRRTFSYARMNSITGDHPFLGAQPETRQPNPDRQRRARKFFRRSAVAAAAACGLVSGIKFWPIAGAVTRFSDSGSDAVTIPDGWTSIAILLFLIVCGVAALAGYLAVRTVGWWVQMRISQEHARIRDLRAAEVQGSYCTSNWEYAGLKREPLVHDRNAGCAEHVDGDPVPSPSEGLPAHDPDPSERKLYRRRHSGDTEAPSRARGGRHPGMAGQGGAAVSGVGPSPVRKPDQTPGQNEGGEYAERCERTRRSVNGLRRRSRSESNANPSVIPDLGPAPATHESGQTTAAHVNPGSASGLHQSAPVRRRRRRVNGSG